MIGVLVLVIVIRYLLQIESELMEHTVDALENVNNEMKTNGDTNLYEKCSIFMHKL